MGMVVFHESSELLEFLAEACRIGILEPAESIFLVFLFFLF